MDEAAGRHRETGCTHTAQDGWHLPFRRLTWIAVASLFAILGGFQIAVAVATPSSREVDGSALFAEIGEETMPVVLAGWSRTDHGSETREAHSEEGEYTHYWVYTQDSSRIRYAMDFPFVGWHELSNCYEGQGWHVDQRDVHTDASDQAYAQVQLSRPTGEFALLCFSLHRADAAAINPDTGRLTLVEKLNTNPLVSRLRGDQVVSQGEMSVQIQQFQLVPVVPTEDDMTAARTTFEQAREILKLSSVFE